MKSILDFVFLMVISLKVSLLPLPMKQFWGQKPLNEILKDAKDKGFVIDSTNYNEWGDFIRLAKKYREDLLSVWYNSFNGQFLGTYWTIEFHSNNAIHDDEHRMIMLCDLFYCKP